MKTPFRATFATFAAAAAVAAALPASAAEPMPQSDATPAATRYCIKETVTGSRLPIKKCHTREQWQLRGVELPGVK